MPRLLPTNVEQKGNLLKCRLSINQIGGVHSYVTEVSPKFVINGAANFQFRLTFSQDHLQYAITYNNLVFVRFNKMSSKDDLTYVINFTSLELRIRNKSFTSDDGTWHLIHENKDQQFSFDVSVVMEVLPSPSFFATLYEDTELTDFELRAEDGSVHVHRALLAAASPVMARLMTGSWREATEGKVDVPSTSQTTLQHLKDYLYLRTLPESGLEQLLLLASCYIIPELEQMCVNQLMSTVSATNACDMIDFACNNKIHRLLLPLLDCVQRGVINVADMRDHYLVNNTTDTVYDLRLGSSSSKAT